MQVGRPIVILGSPSINTMWLGCSLRSSLEGSDPRKIRTPPKSARKARRRRTTKASLALFKARVRILAVCQEIERHSPLCHRDEFLICPSGLLPSSTFSMIITPRWSPDNPPRSPVNHTSQIITPHCLRPTPFHFDYVILINVAFIASSLTPCNTPFGQRRSEQGRRFRPDSRSS